MSYQNCVDALELTLEAVTGLDANIVSQNNHTILGRGGSVFVVLVPNSFEQARRTFGVDFERTWAVDIELYSRFHGQLPGEAMEHLSALRERIVGTVAAKPRLGTANIFDTQILSGSKPEEVFTPDGRGPLFLTQVLRCEIIEGATVAQI